ncbi:recombinase family protein [Streptomyces gobiensis]|uniref:recombinase family protein n=1 Tax=Streptomyces gobiensis TaxID=2875706 RepID=UPI001E4002B2|nr:recombinase family protein [Streptomyces gobiensis]UGY90278.1 recombinase family protein [Streptomyces gobiensis]UGY94933.1 recombinase family protein [Streptomyces gobiensis]
MHCAKTRAHDGPSRTLPSDADDVERHPCPRCAAEPGSPYRSRRGAVAGSYHTGRFTSAPALEAATGADTSRPGPGQPWRPGTPPPAPIDPDTPGADIRIGYARCSTLGQELNSQLDALTKHGIPRDKVFSKKISTRVRLRPQFEAALALTQQIKAPRPTLPGHLHRVRDEATRPGPLPGMYDPSGPGRLLFAFFAAMAETERENIRESTLEGLDTAARKGKHDGRPPVITDDMLHTCSGAARAASPSSRFSPA